MIDQLITALSKEVRLSAEEIADTIWLALQMGQSESISSNFPLSQQDEAGINNRDSQETSPKLQPKTSDSQETDRNQPTEEQKASIYPRTQNQTSTGSDLSFKVPDAPSLREPLTLARALKPLMRRLPSGSTLVLDEAATIQRIADEGLWLPVLRPTLEPWLDLELVVDESISMQIWRHTIRDLERLLKNYGIFRDVRVWGLVADEPEQVQIRRGIGATAKNQPLRSPAELIDPSGRRLVLVVSDCVSSIWRNGKVISALEIWSKRGVMAIVQMLPKWLWKRTALGRASEVRLQGLIPGVFNQKLIAKEVSLWDELEEDKGIKVPVFTLEPNKVATWAQMLAGRGSIWTLGYVFKLDVTLVNKESRLFNLDYDQLSAEQRVQAFRVTASPMARKLAGLLAAAPVITLPIVRLIRETLLKDSQQVHVAEVFLGGLLKPLSEINAETNPDYVQYDFIEEVRELLLDSVPSEYVLSVVDEVSKFVAKKAGFSLDEFAGVLRKERDIKDIDIASNIAHFATVTAQVLRRLGGKYAKFANLLENSISVNFLKKELKLTYDFLWEQGQTKIYTFCTDEPWNLPFDALVIPVGPTIKFGGRLAKSFTNFLGDNFIFLRQSINKAKNDIYKSSIRPNQPLLVALPSEISNQLFSLNNNESESFIICATVEDPEPSIANAAKAVESIIILAAMQRLKCIILPLLGTGNNNLHIYEVAITILPVINKTLKELLFNPIETIVLVDKKEGNIQTLNNVANNLFYQRNIEINEIQLSSEIGIDYTQLHDLLAEGKWREADQETANVMLQASGQQERGWLDEEDMKKFPSTDLQTIDQLWVKYSNGKFGFSVQKRICLSLGGQSGYYDDKIYKQFGEYVGWYIKDKDEWLNWSEHTFSLDAPQGHLPRQLPSRQKRIRPYLLSRKDLKAQLEDFVSEKDEIIESSNNNETLKIAPSVTNNERLVSQMSSQNNPRKNRYDDNTIRILGERGAGKTTFLAALAFLSRIGSEIPFQVFPQDEESKKLLDYTENILMQGDSLPPTNPTQLEELPLYSFNISLKPSLFVQPLSALTNKNVEMNISFREYPGELFNNLRSNRSDRYMYSDYIDDCATVSKLLFLVDGTNRDDRGYAESVITLLEEIAKQRLNNIEILAQYRIAVVISKCEEHLLWINRYDVPRLMSLKFPIIQSALKKWSQSWGCKIAYFVCSSFGVIGNPPRPNFRLIRTDERGIIGVLYKPNLWKPFGLLAPIYWLHTGKNDRRLQK